MKSKVMGDVQKKIDAWTNSQIDRRTGCVFIQDQIRDAIKEFCEMMPSIKWSESGPNYYFMSEDDMKLRKAAFGVDG